MNYALPGRRNDASQFKIRRCIGGFLLSDDGFILYDHLFDFVIPKSRLAPERLLRTINRPNADSAKAFVFSWLDTRDVRAEDAQAVALLNDAEQPPAVGAVEALRSYAIEPVLWSQRAGVRQRLAA